MGFLRAWQAETIDVQARGTQMDVLYKGCVWAGREQEDGGSNMPMTASCACHQHSVTSDASQPMLHADPEKERNAVLCGYMTLVFGLCFPPMWLVSPALDSCLLDCFPLELHAPTYIVMCQPCALA